MESKSKLDNLYRQMEELADSFHYLGDNCSKEAEKLKKFGIPLDSHFIKELENASERFNDIRSELEQAAVELSWKGLNGQADSMAKLQEIWSGLRQHLSVQSIEAASADIRAAVDHGKIEVTGGIPDVAEQERTETDNPDFSADAEQEKFEGTGDLQARYPELLCNLIEEEKLGPAFWLACYCEQDFGTAPVPSWLIKAVEIASSVQGEGGPASKWLSYLYKKHDFQALSKDEHPSRQIAYNLLVYSALLRPAILAPGSGAIVILENLMDLPGSLKTLTAAVRSFGGSEAEGEARREIDNLSREVKVWKKQNQKLTLASPVASKLWEIMLNEKGFLSRLLIPIEENVREELVNIRKLFNYLHEKENLKMEILKLYRDMPELKDNVEIFHFPGSWQIINRMESALKLVERWIKLHVKTEGMNGMEENPLVQSLSESLVSAGKELDGLIWQYQGDPLVKAGAAACIRAIDSIVRLLEKKMETIFSLTPDDVAALETGNNPQLLLKHNREPHNKTVEKMGKALLELLDEMPARIIKKKKREIGSSDWVSQEEVLCPTKPDLDKLCRNGILTAQERDFIRDALKKSLNS